MPDIDEFPIPEIVEPETRICVQFSIPEGDTYKQIMVNWLSQLTYWYNWQRDTGKNGIKCSNLFKQSLDEMIASFTNGCTGGDEMWLRFRYKPGNDRVTQVQYTNGGEWFDAFNLECCDSPPVTNTQITNDGDLQISYDGGDTWVDDPNDPRDTLSILPVPSGNSPGEIRCKVAQSVTEAIKTHQEQLSADAAAWEGISGLVAAVLGLLAFIGIIGSGGALAPLILSIAAALLAAGKAAFDAAFTADVYNQLQCIVYCAVQDDGSILQSGWAEIRNRITTSFTGVAQQYLLKTMDLWQYTGLNNAGRLGMTTDNDCSDCDNCPCQNHWNVLTGEILETPYYEGYVSYLSHHVEGVERVFLSTAETNICCQALDVKINLVGHPNENYDPFFGQVWLCGHDWEGVADNVPLLGNCVSRTYFQTHPVLTPNDVFVMSILWSDCP